MPDLDQSLELLRAALRLQDEGGSPIVAAHISYAIELLEGHVPDEAHELNASALRH